MALFPKDNDNKITNKLLVNQGKSCYFD